MGLKTIRVIDAERRAEARRLNALLRGAEDASARMIVEKSDLVRRHMEALNLKDERIGELVRDRTQARTDYSIALAAKDARISELFQSNNEYQAEARSARAEIARLQQALSDASRVIATLGQRAF